MNVIKVIVDKLPSCCGDCDEYFDFDEYTCNLMERNLDRDNDFDFVPHTYRRQDWCPLVVNNGATIEEIAKHYKESEEE